MKRQNNAFTLTELLVALGVIAILCAVLLPVIFNLMPNQNTIMAKRAYYAAQSVVSELINDEACYPDKTSAVTNPRVGFDDAAGSPNCIKWNESHLNDSSSSSAATKFKTLFTDKLGVTLSGEKFTTGDGINWEFSAANFNSSDDEGGSITLTVDVNGDSKPNCGGSSTNPVSYTGADCTDRTTGFDQFKMKIKGNGQIVINADDKWAINAVKVDRNITSDKDGNDKDD